MTIKKNKGSMTAIPESVPLQNELLMEMTSSSKSENLQKSKISGCGKEECAIKRILTLLRESEDNLAKTDVRRK